MPESIPENMKSPEGFFLRVIFIQINLVNLDFIKLF